MGGIGDSADSFRLLQVSIRLLRKRFPNYPVLKIHQGRLLPLFHHNRLPYRQRGFLVTPKMLAHFIPTLWILDPVRSGL